MTSLRDGIEETAALLCGAKSAVAFTGAGISTPSGIPDFRNPSSGLWSHTDALQVASIYSFRHNPQAFYDWVYPLARLIVQAEPNAAHYALAGLEAEHLLSNIITQNIDMLHTRAGSVAVNEIHGSLRAATCVRCFTEYPGEPLLLRFLADHAIPHCAHCGGVIKPNIILYGEQLPYQALQLARQATRHADVMLVVGSSLEVAPASDLPLAALSAGGKLVIINLTPTDFDSLAQVVIRADAAEALPAIAQRVKAAA